MHAVPEILAWMPICGQGWSDSAASFIGMWSVMMASMMLPSLVPVLWRYRRALDARGEARRAMLMALAAGAYFFVWSAAGAIVYAVLAAFAEFTFQVPAITHAMPWMFAMVILLAGAFQVSAWKAHHLAWCRPARMDDITFAACPFAAWKFGVRLGLHCTLACAGLTAILLVVGMMDLRAMAVMTAVITAERLAPQGQRVAWAAGAVSIVAGLYLMGHAAWPV